MDYRKEFRVQPEAKIKLNKLDPGYTGKHVSHDHAKPEIERYLKKLFHQQNLLYAEHTHSILVVLQALDAGGKDGTIKHVFTALNPQGTSVASFKQPTPVELAHDFLWRVHPHAPGKGEIVIFNRSQFEDVLVPRVHKLIDKATWTKRYAAHLRLRGAAGRERYDDPQVLPAHQQGGAARPLRPAPGRPDRNWKISESDYTERELWDDYIEAFEDMIRATSTKAAPWYVIPSNHKWFRDLAVSQIMADTMEDLKLAFPPPSVDIADIRRKYHAAVKEEKAAGRRRERPLGGDFHKSARNGRRPRAGVGFVAAEGWRAGAAAPRRKRLLAIWRAIRDRIVSVFDSPSNVVLRRLLLDQGAKHWKGYAFGFAMMALIAVTTSLSAWIIGRIVDKIFVGHNLNAVWEITAAIMAIYTVKGLATYGQQVVMSRVANTIVADIQKRIFDQMLRMKVAITADRIRRSSSPGRPSSPSRQATLSDFSSPRCRATR